MKCKMSSAGGAFVKIGVIGTGNMGTILIQALIESNSVKASDITITNRTLEKANRLKAQYPNLHVAASANDTAKNSDFVFICVKPTQFYPLLKKINESLSNEKVLISITSPISTEELEGAVSCQVARVIPSITNRALSGCSLITVGKRMSKENQKKLVELLDGFSQPIYIEEENTRVASDIVSCGPAFLSYLLQCFINAAVRQTSITKEQATELTSEMLIGLGKLIEKNVYSLETLQEKVNVKGGITGMGLQVLEDEVGDMFDLLFKETHKKYEEDRKEITEQFFSRS